MASFNKEPGWTKKNNQTIVIQFHKYRKLHMISDVSYIETVCLKFFHKPKKLSFLQSNLHNFWVGFVKTQVPNTLVTTTIVAFESYKFLCSKQKKSDSFKQIYADLVELASRTDCGDHEDEWMRDMFTTHMNMKKLRNKY